MRIGIPRETKTLEGRVALVPAAAGDLVRRGHEVWIEKDAGVKSGFKDEQYTRLGVHIAPDAAALYEKGRLDIRPRHAHADLLAQAGAISQVIRPRPGCASRGSDLQA